MKKIILLTFCFSLIVTSCKAQKELVSVIEEPKPEMPTTNKSTYWQQHVDYSMDIDVDVNTFQYKGQQKAVYTNNSPDVLNKVF